MKARKIFTLLMFVIMFTGIRYQRGPSGQPNDGSKPQRPNRKRG